MSTSRFLLVTICLALACLVARPALGQTWTVLLSKHKQGNILTLTSPELTVSLLEQQYWTLHEVHYRKQKLVGQFGANGAVVNVRGDDGTKLKDPWIGTGHGKEKLKTFVVELDGKPVELKPGDRHTADEVKLTKTSVIGPFDETAVMHFPKTGDRLVERNSFTTNRELKDVFNFLYAYMHCNVNKLTHWRAWLDKTKTLDGVVEKDDRTFHLNKEIHAVVFFGPEIDMGIAYVYPEVYKGAGRKNMIWDRPQDNKLYLWPAIPKTTGKGETFTYEVTVIPFAAEDDAWKDTADKLVSPMLNKDE